MTTSLNTICFRRLGMTLPISCFQQGKIRRNTLHLWIEKHVSLFPTQNCFYALCVHNFRANYCADTNIDKSKLTHILNQYAQSRRNAYIVINNLQHRKGAVVQWLTLKTFKLEMCVRDRLFHFQTQLLYKKIAGCENIYIIYSLMSSATCLMIMT